MLEGGAVVIHRSITQWEWYTDVPTRVLFEHFIITANWKDSKFKGETIARGEVVCTKEKLADETGLTYKQVRRAIANLQNSGEIDVRRADKGQGKSSVVTVKNYSLYQLQGRERAEKGQRKGNIDNKAIKQLNNINNNNNTHARNAHAREVYISLVLKDGTEYQVSEERVAEWETLFPTVDVKQQLRTMKAWCEANPSKRKTKQGILRFITSWLSRAQGSGKKDETKSYDTDDRFANAVRRTSGKIQKRKD